MVSCIMFLHSLKRYFGEAHFPPDLGWGSVAGREMFYSAGRGVEGAIRGEV